MAAVNKVVYSKFNLATVAGRIGLLCGITAGTVLRDEVEAAVLQDTEKRPHRKPVVFRGRRYSSVTAAAESACGINATRKEINAMQKNISRWATEDCWQGIYWSV